MTWSATITGWTDERLARLKKMWGDGFSASEIARSLGGCTRNSVIGIVHRRGWQRDLPKVQRLAAPRVGGAAAVARAKSATPVEPCPRQVQTRSPTIAVSRLKPLLPVPKAPTVADASLARPFTLRAFGECAYPISGDGADTLSCCQPVTPVVIREVGGKPTGGRYCRSHEKLMYVPSKPRAMTRDLIRSTRRYA